MLVVPSCLALVLWLFCPWFLLMATHVLWPLGVLWSRMVCPRPFWPLWELGQPGVPLSACPLPWPLPLGLLGALAGLLPCPALARAAISLPICFPTSVVCFPEFVATTALALTLSWISSFFCFPPFRWQPSTVSKKSLGCCRDTWWNLRYVCRPYERGSLWGVVGPVDPSSSRGIAA